ncbi:MAG: hypothetical protein JSW38_07125 [Dehalococcoidia bacterium]|nr:MAG: hypothetical protein JSW38_07125 [Dehalococcoidia bacterium]
MHNLKNFLSASLTLALAIIVGLHIALLWSSGGELLIGENNKVILIVESVMAFGIFFFGIERLLSAIRTKLNDSSLTVPSFYVTDAPTPLDGIARKSPYISELPAIEHDNVSAISASELRRRTAFDDQTESATTQLREIVEKAHEGFTVFVEEVAERAKAEANAVFYRSQTNYCKFHD